MKKKTKEIIFEVVINTLSTFILLIQVFANKIYIKEGTIPALIWAGSVILSLYGWASIATGYWREK